MFMKKVLFVSDNIETVSSWQKILTSENFILDTAFSCNEALNCAETCAPDIIVFDNIKISDEIFIKRLRKNKKISDIHIFKLKPEDKVNPDDIIVKIENILMPHRILIAEDDRQLSNIFSIILKDHGYDVKSVHDGVDVLRKIKSWHPNLLLLDIMLPVLDGFHVCNTMNEDSSFEPLPKILIISSRDSQWDHSLGQACGAEDYLVKPFSSNLLLYKVKEILNKIKICDEA